MRFVQRLMCFLLSYLFVASASAQSLDGAWKGSMTCSENITNRNPGYTVSLDLQISGTTGKAERSDTQSLEIFSLKVQPSGTIELQSTGRLKNDTTPRWTTRFAGSAAGSNKFELIGQMYAADARTLVRERCSVVLQRSSQAMANNVTSPSSDQPVEMLRRNIDASSSTGNVQSTPSIQQSSTLSGLDHRTFRIREVTPKRAPLSTGSTNAGPNGLPLGEGGALYLPEDWLMGPGQRWHYRTSPRSGASPVPVRRASADELKVMEKAHALMQRIESRVLVLLADGEIVDVISTGGISFDTRLLSASMAKTVTAIAAGKAMCAGRITLNSRADSLVTSLKGTDLGAATLRDALMMASGTTEPMTTDYVGTTLEETREYLEGSGNLEQLLATPRQSSAQRSLFGKLGLGERFSYKARDPFVVAMMLERSVGMPATRWLEEQLLAEIGIEHQAILGTDRSGYFHGANGGVRLALIDWIRLANYVDQQRRTETCFGRFIKEMGTTQIRAPGVTKGFDGYGYLTWTDNSFAPNTFWAVGYGGQRIGWSSDPNNKRVFLMFSNSADRDMDQVYPLAREWFSLGQKR